MAKACQESSHLRCGKINPQEVVLDAGLDSQTVLPIRNHLLGNPEQGRKFSWAQTERLPVRPDLFRRKEVEFGTQCLANLVIGVKIENELAAITALWDFQAWDLDGVQLIIVKNLGLVSDDCRANLPFAAPGAVPGKWLRLDLGRSWDW